ncbi:MAG: hypothetical protein WC683_20185 [bacterium]
MTVVEILAKGNTQGAGSPKKQPDLSWFAERVKRSQEKPFSEIVTIEPALAKSLLERNEANRKLNEGLVSKIADDIRGGYWELNGETIIIAKDGQLNDGQHRLNAVVAAGKSIQTLVFFGAERDSRFTVDVGNQRSTGDFLGMEGVKYSNAVAAAARLHWAHRRGLVAGAGSPTKQCVRAEYWSRSKMFDKAASHIHSKFAIMYGFTPMVCAYVILHDVNAARTIEFFDKLISGENLKRGDAILALRARLIECREDNLRAWEKLEMILRYWNHWRLAKPVGRAIPLQGQYPKIER